MLAEIRPSDIERFWRKVIPTPTASGCIEWNPEHATCRGGYGTIRWKNDRMVEAHRVAFELANGREPVGVVRHTCDNPPCVNGLHLVDGTYSENVTDMHDRNPNSRTDRAHGRRLTFAQVDHIRRLYRDEGLSSYELGQIFGVTQTVALDAAVGRSYKRGPTEPPAPRRTTHGILTDLTRGA